MSRLVQLLVTIDTECDKGPGWEVRRPLAFTGVRDGVRSVLGPLFRCWGVKPTYLLSPEVIADERAADDLGAEEGCELGTHLHGEFVEPEADWGALRTRTPQFFYSRSVEEAKLTNLSALFRDRFGKAPRAFRAGRFGIGRNSLRILAELGYSVDSSVTPCWVHLYDSSSSRNFWGAPLGPYHPKPSDPVRRGRSPLLEIPVTIINQSVARIPRRVLRWLFWNPRYGRRLLGRLGCRVEASKWLRPLRSSGPDLTRIADWVVESWRGPGPAILNMMYHNVEAVPGASPYSQSPEDVKDLVRSQEILFAHLYDRYDVQSVGLGELTETHAGESRTSQPYAEPSKPRLGA